MKPNNQDEIVKFFIQGKQSTWERFIRLQNLDKKLTVEVMSIKAGYMVRLQSKKNFFDEDNIKSIIRYCVMNFIDYVSYEYDVKNLYLFFNGGGFQ